MHTATVHKDAEGKERIYIFGGVTRNYIPLDDLWVFDVSDLKWEHPISKALPPYPRMMHTAVAIRDQLMVFGGMANNIPLEDTWVYHIKDKTWNEEYPHTAFPFAREGASLIHIQPPEPTSVPVQPNNAWLPPPPDEPEKSVEVANGITQDRSPEAVAKLMPTIKDTKSARPLNRARKLYNLNSFVIIFGGAGPKPK